MTDAIKAAGKVQDDVDKPLWYGVRRGHNRGVYNDWHQCRAQTAGYRGAHCACHSPTPHLRPSVPGGAPVRISLIHADDMFASPEEAHAFVVDKPFVMNVAGNHSKMTQYWGVVGGNFTGVALDFDTVKKSHTGSGTLCYKSFATRGEAEDYVKERTEMTPNPGPAHLPKAGQSGDNDLANANDCTNSSKFMGKSSNAMNKMIDNRRTGSASLPDGFIEVYTDGSSSLMKNPDKGKPDFRIAGLGVYFGPNDERNLAEPVQGESNYHKTNQRAEVTAVLRALQSVSKDQALLIWTDSMFVVESVTERYREWEECGWTTSRGKPVSHQDLFRDILDLIRQRPAKTSFQWCKGHAGTEGNEAADKLAEKGAAIALQQILKQQ